MNYFFIILYIVLFIFFIWAILYMFKDYIFLHSGGQAGFEDEFDNDDEVTFIKIGDNKYEIIIKENKIK